MHFETPLPSDDLLRNIESCWLLGCGTSWHAGSIGASYLEELARIPSQCEIASEARYRTPLIHENTLTFGISQSGETADTLAALRLAKSLGSPTLSITNVRYSTITRETDYTLFLRAGTEVSVCSTKSLTSQIATLALFALYMAQMRGLSRDTALSFFAALEQIPEQIEQVLELAPQIEKIAEKYAAFNDFFFLGRRYMHITALEAALKLKEISYVNANAYPAGELKHGPIALLDEQFPVIAFCANEKTKEKLWSNLAEVKARSAPILAFAPRGMDEVSSLVDDLIWLPPSSDLLAPFASTVAGQLLAYYIAKQRGCNIDQPRNLAKSVTVE